MTSHRSKSRPPYKPTNRELRQAQEAATFGPRRIGDPQPGWFKLRLVKGGAYVAARIRYAPSNDPETGEPLDRSWLWHGEIDGAPDRDAKPSPTDAVWRIWLGGERITESDFTYLSEAAAWARRHAAALPEANPRAPVDLRTLDPKLLL